VNKGNPFDYALRTFQWSAIVDIARNRLLKRYPIGTPTADLRGYLESVGASCTRKADGPLECRYSQYVLYGNRGIIGDEWRFDDHYDFTTRLWPGRGPVTELTMCNAMATTIGKAMGCRPHKVLDPRVGGEAVQPFTPGLGRDLSAGRRDAPRSSFSGAPKDVGGYGQLDRIEGKEQTLDPFADPFRTDTPL
jgi:hypothetical protein